MNQELVNGILPIAQSFGFSPELMLMLVAFIISLMIGVFCAGISKEKNIGVAGFFLTMGICTVIGALEWYVLLVPLVIISGYYIQEGSK